MPDPACRLQLLASQSVQHDTPFNGGVLSWRRWSCDSSKGRPLVLLHGGFGSWTHWAANLESLRLQRSVWTVDLPGLGESADMAKPYTSEHFAQLLMSGLDEVLGREAEFDLAGFSFGAMLGAHMAVTAGTRCKRLITIGAAGCGALHVQVDLRPPPAGDASEAEIDTITRENLQRLMLAKASSIDELAVYIHADNLARHRFRSRKLSKTDDLLRVLPEISAQLVGVWGSEDATAGGMGAINLRREVFSEAQPHALFHILPGIGHWAMYEAPEQINRILLDQPVS